jgi:hypothetical protein
MSKLQRELESGSVPKFFNCEIFANCLLRLRSVKGCSRLVRSVRLRPSMNSAVRDIHALVGPGRD